MKLIVTDMDGTLLNEFGKISAENAQAIRYALKQGIEVVVATGRSFETAYQVLDAAGLNLPIIGLNGAVIYTEKQQLIQSLPLEIEVARTITTLCQAENMYFEIFTSHGIFSISRKFFINVVIDIAKKIYPNLSVQEINKRANDRFNEEKIQITSDYNKLLSKQNIDIYKILVFSPNLKSLERLKDQLKEEQKLTITASADINLEFTHPQAQKGIALQSYASNKGIQMKDVMAIGDHYNDLSMLKVAGIKVAMENGAEEIKQYCHFVTKTNQEHGVAFAIKKMLTEHLQK